MLTRQTIEARLVYWASEYFMDDPIVLPSWFQDEILSLWEKKINKMDNEALESLYVELIDPHNLDNVIEYEPE